MVEKTGTASGKEINVIHDDERRRAEYETETACAANWQKKWGFLAAPKKTEGGANGEGQTAVKDGPATTSQQIGFQWTGASLERFGKCVDKSIGERQVHAVYPDLVNVKLGAPYKG